VVVHVHFMLNAFDKVGLQIFAQHALDCRLDSKPGYQMDVGRAKFVIE